MISSPHAAPPNFDWIIAYKAHHHERDALIISARTAHGRTVEIVVNAVTPTIWRMRMVIPGMTAQAPTPILIPAQRPPVPLHISESDAHLCLDAGASKLQIDKQLFCLRLLNAAGREIVRENPFDLDGLGRSFILPLGFVADASAPLITETLHLRPDEHLFGLGEKFTPLDKRGQRIISWTQDAFGSTSERSHKNIPLLISTRGYGLLLDTGARITWELGTVSCQSWTCQIEGTTLDAYLIVGDTPAAILEQYADLTGRAPLPPRWSFGLWLSGAGVYRDRAAIEALVEQAEAHDLPVDVIHVDTWWMKWRHYADWRFDAEAFPDAAGFIAGLHARGLKLSLWEQPYISIESDRFSEGKARGYFLTRADGEVYVIDYGLSLAPRPDGIIRTADSAESWNAPVAIIDLTNPAALAWFQELHRPLLELGVDVFKTDFGEDVPRDAIFSSGQTGAELHNLYPLVYNAAVSAITQTVKGHGLVWGRSGTAGSQRYPVCWSGDPAADWDSLACTIRGGLSIGMSGIPFWSSDIGGFRGMPSPELYIRWAQFTLLCSHARMHGDSAREPWAYGAQAVEIVRKFVRLRYQLFPYLYHTAHQAATRGLPVIRALPLAFPDDPNTYDKDLQFMLGDALLVAPIYDDSDTRRVYLPAGTWIDFWTGAVYTGECNLRVHAPLATLPLFVRAGAIIPMMPDAQRIPERLDAAILTIYLDAAEDAITQSWFWDDAAEPVTLTYVQLAQAVQFTWRGRLPARVTLRVLAGGAPLTEIDINTQAEVGALLLPLDR